MKKSDKSACGAAAWTGAAVGVGAMDAGVGIGTVDCGGCEVAAADVFVASVTAAVVVVGGGGGGVVDVVVVIAAAVVAAAAAVGGADVADGVAEVSISGAAEAAALASAGAGDVAGRHRSAEAFPSLLPHGAFGSMPAIEAEHTGHVHRNDSFASIYAHARTPGALSAVRSRFCRRLPRELDTTGRASKRGVTLRSSSLYVSAPTPG